MHCVTNDTTEFRSCTVRDAHTANCPMEADPTVICRGCMPREATHGLLCARCWGRLERAEDAFSEFLRELRGVRSAYTPEGLSGGSTGPRLPFTQLELDRDEIFRYRRVGPASLAMWVATPEGAVEALRFERSARNIGERYPWREAAHAIPTTRCPNCSKVTLSWYPPAYEGAPVQVMCHDDDCGYSMAQDKFEFLADLEEHFAGREKKHPDPAWIRSLKPERPVWPSLEEVQQFYGRVDHVTAAVLILKRETGEWPTVQQVDEVVGPVWWLDPAREVPDVA